MNPFNMTAITTTYSKAQCDELCAKLNGADIACKVKSRPARRVRGDNHTADLEYTIYVAKGDVEAGRAAFTE